MRGIPTVVKNAEDTRTYMFMKGWSLVGETITLETLFSMVVNPNFKFNNKDVINPLLAVAYLITEELEDNIRLNVVDTITKHLLDALTSITSSIQDKLKSHLLAVNNSTKSHHELNEKLQQTQEKLDKTAQKVTTSTKMYSQAAANPPFPPLFPPLFPPPLPFPPITPNAAYSQIQIRNNSKPEQPTLKTVILMKNRGLLS